MRTRNKADWVEGGETEKTNVSEPEAMVRSAKPLTGSQTSPPARFVLLSRQ